MTNFDEWYVLNDRTHNVVYYGTQEKCKSIIQRYKSRRYKMALYSAIPLHYTHTYHLNALEEMYSRPQSPTRR
jgi:hypothetical protein